MSLFYQRLVERNLLKLNSDKTDFLLFRTSVQRNKLTNSFSTLRLGENVQPSKELRCSVLLRYARSQHVSALCRSDFFHIEICVELDNTLIL